MGQNKTNRKNFSFSFKGEKNGENKTHNFRCIVTTKDFKISNLYLPRKKRNVD